MKAFINWVALPTTLLAVICQQACAVEELQWPRDEPQAEFHRDHEEILKREVEAEKRLKREIPLGMKKMGVDAGEKFFLDYWAFEGMHEGDTQELGGNSSGIAELQQAVAMHKQYEKRRYWNLLGRDLFSRDFRCPGMTERCSSIGSELCCDAGQTCISTSEGVGCCPSGANCGNDIAGCNTAAGYTSCPNSPNGGCCIPGASCLDIGCVFYGTDTVVVAPATPSTTSRPSPNPSPTTITTDHTQIVLVTVSESGSVYTTTVVSATTVTILPSSVSPASSPRPTTSTSATAIQPVRPNSSAASTSTSRSPVSGCPTGFYMCSAVYLGGCCRVDRNCDTTSCPSTATTNVVETNGVTIGVAATATDGAGRALTGRCANGWQSCAPSLGGGCCPTQYACGIESCGATAAGGEGTGKVAPSEGAMVVLGWSFLVLAGGIGVGMIWL
ncbi:unnamed protein product [Zymoseptoria tritici ST99CH_3D7]|uniref:GPI anchored protein n=1 Tax=Zymoseptoria tritici (strain ST99CH_3D7) TaxID=1276538 RepID=A0A1X7S7G6_ZYMT9|nr:unnamed protein product [Zymoseptoria tritici ST99CH_3D7]